MAEEATQNTLRDVIAEQVNKLDETPQVSPEPPASAATPAEPATPPKEDVPEPERARDAQGRFIEKKEEAVKTPQAPAAASPSPVQPSIPRPSSWKKDYWPLWDKLTSGQPLTPEESKSLATYANQREGDFAKGVSTYKQEWERAKPILDAVAPYQEHLQRTGVNPAQLFQRYAELDRTLSSGTPEQKLGIFLKAAQDYQVPLQNLFTRGQDGQIYFNPQVQSYQQPQQQAQQPNVETVVQNVLAKEKAVQELAAFEAEVNAGQHQHYEALRPMMAQLLDAGLAKTVKSAYDAALRHPENSSLYEADQKQAAEKEALEKQRKAAEEAARARRQTVSPKTQTPMGSAKSDKPKSVRESVLEAFDQHHQEGRV